MNPSDLEFCILSFEGPDRYARAGGLAVRVTYLARALANRGFTTHLVFVGDPTLAGREKQVGGRLTLHRWCQWISRHHPGGTYDGEEGKLFDFRESVPPFVLEEFIEPAVVAGRVPVILAEEWHTAEAVINLRGLLESAGLGNACTIFWNANNTMSFHRVDWPRLSHCAHLTTVSRYMKHLMWGLGMNPLVIPNGIPEELFGPLRKGRAGSLRRALQLDERDVILFKAGRFDPAKRWIMAVDAVARLKQLGHRVAFLISGGIEPHRGEVFDRIRCQGLSRVEVEGEPNSWAAMLELMKTVPSADVYNLCFFMPNTLLQPVYGAADGVLANSGHEPFGLVGLEAMAAGALVFTGATGEEYASDGQCAVALDTDQPDEIVTYLLELKEDRHRANTMRLRARQRARVFGFDKVVDILLDKVRFALKTQQAVSKAPVPRPLPKVKELVIYAIVHQPQRLRLPAVSIPEQASVEDLRQAVFDWEMNERYFKKVASTCYYPALERILRLVKKELRLGIGISLSFVEQAQRWDEDLLDRFRELVNHPNVELIAVEPEHGMIALWDIGQFAKGMRRACKELKNVFGRSPVVADTTELMMSNTIYYALDSAGFKAGFMDGRPWVLEWRQPSYLYHHNRGNLKILTRHYQLSDDIGYRFSNRGWDRWPLMADTYACWLADHPGQFLVLGWDFETFGEHHRVESGIFEFLEAFPEQARRAGLSFLTPSQAVDHYADGSYDLPLPAFPSTWAGSGGLEFFVGNDVQRAVFGLMMQAYEKACLTRRPELIDLALRLAQSDNLHLIQWFGRSGSEAEVSGYFTRREWWDLGTDRIVWEIQQVYKNFIAALDERVPLSKPSSLVKRPQVVN